MVAKSNTNRSWTKILQKHQNLKIAHTSQNCTFNDKDFSFLIQITHFYNYQKIQVEVPYNSTVLDFLKMWQNSSYWELIWLQLPPLTWH
jgi:hypothetical protein